MCVLWPGWSQLWQWSFLQWSTCDDIDTHIRYIRKLWFHQHWDVDTSGSEWCGKHCVLYFPHTNTHCSRQFSSLLYIYGPISHDHPWLVRDVCECLWVSVSVCECLWVSVIRSVPNLTHSAVCYWRDSSKMSNLTRSQFVCNIRVNCVPVGVCVYLDEERTGSFARVCLSHRPVGERDNCLEGEDLRHDAGSHPRSGPDGAWSN